MAPPTPKNIAMYHKWCMSREADNDEFPAQLDGASVVTLRKEQSILIPSGWIHAVFTPEVSTL
jgi:F-box/leucine-rich repeat protein 10/11